MNKNNVIDIVEIAGKTVLSAISVGGALITAVYDAVKGNVLSRRQEEWKKVLEERLSNLEDTLANAVVNTTNLDLNEEKLIVFLDLLDKFSLNDCILSKKKGVLF